MANIKYFHDAADGSTVSLVGVWFSGANPNKAAAFSGWGPDGLERRCTRKVEMKSFPTRHACDNRCLNATGKIMKCECSCGGKNHGKGSISSPTPLRCDE